MFSKPRPVPSKAALKFLYQLAYISSGTAVGVATLCAEERRRRTHIVQKIADNAKRLRQSPRHVHNVAVLTEQDEDQDWEQQAQVHMRYTEGTSRSRERQRERYSSLRDRSAHAPELPSYVERGYGQLVETDYKRTRRRAMDARSGTTVQSEERTRRRREASSATPAPPGKDARTLDIRASKDHRATTTTVSSRDLLKDKVRFALNRAPLAAARPASVASEGDHAIAEHSRDQGALKSAAERRGPLLEGGIAQALSKVPSSAETSTDQSPEHQEHAQPAIERDTPPAGLHNRKEGGSAEDTRVHQDSSKNGNSSPSARKRDQIAKHKILASDDLFAIRSLLQSEGPLLLLTAEGFQAICEKARTLAPRNDPDELVQVYTQIFKTSAVQRLSQTDQLHCAFIVLVQVVGSGIELRQGIISPLLRTMLSPKEKSDVLGEALLRFCEGLVEQSRAGDACELIRACRSWSKEQTQYFQPEDRVSWALLDSGSLDRCAKMLRPRLVGRHVDRFLPHIERLALLCHQARSYRPLIIMLNNKLLYTVPESFKELSGEARLAIAIACTTSGVLIRERVLDSAYCMVPEPMRRAVDEARTCTELRERWKSTHDFDLVWVRYISAKKFAALRQLGEDILRNLELTMVEICNSANRPDRALELLTGLSADSSHSPHSLGLTAVALAKKKAWSQLHDFLGLLEKSRALISTNTANRALNNVIHLYSRSHTAADTWKFVTGMIKNLNFGPSRSTSTIMLQCFVSKQQLEYVPRWLRLLKTLGHTTQMDPWMAADLLKCYYLERRPPHVLFTGLCRDLIHRIPSVETEDLQNVVKESISYDLRKLDAQDKPKLQEKARTNMSLLSDNGISTAAMRAELLASGGPSPLKYTGASRPTTQIGASQIDHLPVPITDVAELKSHIPYSAATTASHTFYDNAYDDNAFGLRDQRREAELAAEERMQQLMEDINADDTETNLSANSNPASIIVGPEGLDDRLLTAPTGATSIGSTGDPALESHRVFEHDAAGEMDDGQAKDHLDYAHNQRLQQRLMRDMVASFSLQHYRSVIDLYHESTGIKNLPATPKALEISVEASLRSQRGNPAEATAMITAARDAGLNVTCATGPMLLHQMWHLDLDDQRNANLLRVAVTDWYRTNAENGWPVSHHVGVTAANILVNKGRPEHGISILNSIYHSEWAQERDFDIAPMSVYLRGYAALGSDKGLQWTLSTVMRKDIRIDRKFLVTLQRAREIYGELLRRRPELRGSMNMLAALRRWRSVFSERRERQRIDTKLFGRRLRDVIVDCMELSREPVGESDVRLMLETETPSSTPPHETKSQGPRW
ncbi:uncharacterized protein CLAFUR5_05888 [Fulvia fulva]|uniref:Uncharacterized protein n=1 Tax=Passalora fulva TaxID=5499 RepID=A0A9Q8P8R4_PASFU|nr:uncharacterized protein CLAFUR5_05888 [Fulvia fulva]KAK4625049.1 hypothetical protein CLAFUR0_05750 [Fulvia fulva]UJO17383.1 hypothetical protein CLAFUR5_05888 [Fulvia fulva]